MYLFRLSLVRDGREEVWFTNYDLSVVRQLKDLLSIHHYFDDLYDLKDSLSDLLECAENGD